MITGGGDVIDDGERGGIEQQGAGVADRCTCVDRTAHDQRFLARNFDKATVAVRLTAARAGMPVETRGVVGPHHDLAAITRVLRVGMKRHLAADECRAGVGHVGVGAVNVAADQHLATALRAGRVEMRVVLERDVRTEHGDRTASARVAACR